MRYNSCESIYTLCRRKPSFIKASKPDIAIPLYELCKDAVCSWKKNQTGFFGADMQVALINDGPVTIIIDSKIE
jgi:D-tyrosyl-tRNA(Tyr) deacylase